jgi:glycosyltransferase involved in cell wall biosynthesis
MKNDTKEERVSRGRVCVVRHGYYPNDARVRKEVHALCESGYAVDVVCLRREGQKRREEAEGVRVYRLGHERRRGSLPQYVCDYAASFVKMLGLVTVLFFRRRYTCIQVNTLPDLLVFVTLVPRLFGASVLIDMHEPSPELFVTKFGGQNHRWAVRLLIWLEQMSLRYATAAITVNDCIKQRFVERGTPSRKIHVVRNVPEKDICTEGSDGSTDGRFNLLIHGLIAERYGHETVLRALAIVRDRVQNLHLTIAGSGDGEEKVQRLTRELDCSDIVTSLGWVPVTRIRELIASTDIGLVPLLRSPFAELCQPNKLFELAAGKRTIVASRLRAIEESFDDSCVKFFEPGNHEDLARCIIELYHDRQQGRMLAQNARHRYEEMRWEYAKKDYLRVVDGLMQNQQCDMALAKPSVGQDAQ